MTFNHRIYGEFVFADPKALQQGGTQTYFSTTVKGLERENQLAPAIVRSVQQDSDRDGLAERWNVSMRIKKPEVATTGSKGVLRNAKIVLGFKWETHELVKTEMESLAVINVQEYTGGSTLSAASIKTVGILSLKQEAPSKTTRGTNRRYNDDLFLSLGH